VGLVVGVEIIDPANGAGPDPDRAERILYGALSRGLSFKVSGGNVLTLMPPLTVSDAELARATDILDASVEASGATAS
jgi:4-aminobutyrate aminotransferase